MENRDRGGKIGIFVARDKRIPYGRIEHRGERVIVPLNECPRLAVGENILSIVWRSVIIDTRNVKKEYFKKIFFCC